MEKKQDKRDLAAISEKWSEPEYRRQPELSYSTLKKFEGAGDAAERFAAIPTLEERITSPSLTFGSMVDTLVTGSKDEFDRLFLPFDGEVPNENLKAVCDTLYANNESLRGMTLAAIPDTVLARECDAQGYGKTWRMATKAEKVRENCSAYWNALGRADGRTLVSNEDASDAISCWRKLKESDATKWYFEDDMDNPWDDDDTKRFYQLKFKAYNGDVGYRSMTDLLVVDYKSKTVHLCDLKTTGKPEYLFYKSFLHFRYDIQARLYWWNVRQNMDKDPVFRDFALTNMKFIVINRDTQNPLVWEYPLSSARGDIATGQLMQTTLRDPLDIGRELWYYLKHPEIKEPVGIHADSTTNILTDFTDGAENYNVEKYLQVV